MNPKASLLDRDTCTAQPSGVDPAFDENADHHERDRLGLAGVGDLRPRAA